MGLWVYRSYFVFRCKAAQHVLFLIIQHRGKVDDARERGATAESMSLNGEPYGEVSLRQEPEQDTPLGQGKTEYSWVSTQVWCTFGGGR